jgi:hypothetical protein
MIGLIDVDSKLPNLALMKISNYYKSLGEQVEFVKEKGVYSRIYASAVFTKSEEYCRELVRRYGNLIEIGGTGFDVEKKLPPEIESMKPDYDLYTAERVYERIKRGIGKKESKMAKAQVIVDAGLGFSSRGCVRSCSFCRVPKKEGKFCQASEIRDLLNPRSNVLVLNDNNLTADPLVIDKLHEIRDRGLTIDINQGIDIRLVTDEIAYALSKIRHLRSTHFAWDLMGFENQVFRGIRTLSKYIKPYRQMCYELVGYNTEFEQDMYRFRKLTEFGIAPFVMIYDEKPDIRLRHFARWVNSRIYKVVSFDNYLPWINAKIQMAEELEIERTQLKWAF